MGKYLYSGTSCCSIVWIILSTQHLSNAIKTVSHSDSLFSVFLAFDLARWSNSLDFNDMIPLEKEQYELENRIACICYTIGASGGCLFSFFALCPALQLVETRGHLSLLHIDTYTHTRIDNTSTLAHSSCW